MKTFKEKKGELYIFEEVESMKYDEYTIDEINEMKSKYKERKVQAQLRLDETQLMLDELAKITDIK